MKVIMLSRLEELRLGPKREPRQVKPATKWRKYERSHPMELLVPDDMEQEEREFWGWVALPKAAKKIIGKKRGEKS